MPQEEAPGDRRELAAFPASAVAQPLARITFARVSEQKILTPSYVFCVSSYVWLKRLVDFVCSVTVTSSSTMDTMTPTVEEESPRIAIVRRWQVSSPKEKNSPSAKVVTRPEAMW